MGCNIFRVTPKSQNLSENIRQVSEIMKTAITIFSTQIWRNGRRCTASSAKIRHKNKNCPRTPCVCKQSGLCKRMYNSVLKVGLRRYATDFFACSKDAGRYLFGDKILEKAISEFCRMRLIQKATPTIRAQEKE